jgi:hypothetical protein
LTAGNAAQFPINEWHQPVEGIALAKPDLGQKPAHLSAIVRHIPTTNSSCSDLCF